MEASQLANTIGIKTEDIIKTLDSNFLFQNGNKVSVKNAEEIIDRFLLYSSLIEREPQKFKTKEIPFTKGPRVYFLLWGDFVAYIGQTMHLASRIAMHIHDGRDFDFVAYIDVCQKDMMMVEAFNINYHSPEMNQEIDSTTELLRRVAKSVGY